MEANRSKWSFAYTAARLAEGAAAQKAHRESRLAWWEGKKAELMQKVKDSGIEMTESLALGYSNTSAGFGPKVTVRPDLQQKLSECHQKILAHAAAVKEYDGWYQVLTANTEERLELTQADWLYFFGK